MASLAPHFEGELALDAPTRAYVDREARALLAWRAGLHRPGGAALTRWLGARLDPRRTDFVVHLAPRWGGAMSELMRRPVRPAVRVAVAPEGQSGDGRHTLRREGKPHQTGLVVSSVDLVIAEGPGIDGPERRGAWLSEVSRVLRSGATAALHLLAGRGEHPFRSGEAIPSPWMWERALDDVGLRCVEMQTAPWRWPAWWTLAAETGFGRYLRDAHRLARLDERGTARRQLRARCASALGLAVIACRR